MTEPNPNPNPDDKGTPPAVPPAGVTPPAEPPAGKTYTQAEIDQMITNRLNREKKNWEKTLEEQKVKDQMSAEERLKAEKAESEAKAKAAEDMLLAVRKETAVIAAAAKLGATDPEDVWALINKEGLDIGTDGKVIGADKAVEDLLKAKPYLKRTDGKGPIGNPTNPAGGGGGSPVQDMNKAIRMLSGRG